MITNVVESKYTGWFWRVCSFFVFMKTMYSYKRRVGIGVTLNEQTGDYDMRILYHGLNRGAVSDIVKQFVEFDQASTQNLESIDRRITTSD